MPGLVCGGDNVAAVTDQPCWPFEDLHRSGTSAVLGCLGRLWEAAPYRPADTGDNLVVGAELNGGPCRAAQAVAPALQARTVVEDVALEGPAGVVFYFDPIPHKADSSFD